MNAKNTLCGEIIPQTTVCAYISRNLYRNWTVKFRSLRNTPAALASSLLSISDHVNLSVSSESGY